MATLSEGALFTLLEGNHNATASTSLTSPAAPVITPTTLPTPPEQPAVSISLTFEDTNTPSVSFTTPTESNLEPPTDILRPGPIPTAAEPIPDASGIVSDTAVDPQVTSDPSEEQNDDSVEEPVESPPAEEPLETDVDLQDPIPSSDADILLSPTEVGEMELSPTELPDDSISVNPGETSNNPDTEPTEDNGEEQGENVGNDDETANTDENSGGNNESDDNGDDNNDGSDIDDIDEQTQSDGSFQELPQETGIGDQDEGDGSAVITSDPGVTVIPVATSTLADGVVTSISLEPTATGSTIGDATGERSGGDDPMGPDDASPSSSKPSTGAIVGGAVGGAAALALLILLFWLLRRRGSNKGSLRSPEFERGLPDRAEKTWEFDTGSLGPTPRTAKFAAAISHNVGKIGRAFGGSPNANAINMNRGNSQFFEAAPVGHNRSGSALDVRASEVPSVKGRFKDWWSRVIEDHDQATEAAYFAQRSMERTHSASNSDAALHGTLGLALGYGNNDPFADTNAVRQQHAVPRDPFADPESVRPPSSIYHRPRGESLSQPLTSGLARSQSPPSRHSSVDYAGVDRTKFRSDPFDLELSASVGGTMASAYVRDGRDSYTSRVSSLDDWSDPGPDVGHSAGRSGIGQAS